MKTFWVVGTFFASMMVGGLSQEEMQEVRNPNYVVAKITEKPPISNDEGWTVKNGEVYKFIMFVSLSEYNGGKSDSRDKTFCLLGMDDIQVISRTKNFSKVTPENEALVISKYQNQIVVYRKQLAMEQERQARIVRLMAERRAYLAELEKVRNVTESTYSRRGQSQQQSEFNAPNPRVHSGGTLDVKPNGYGLGVNIDQFGGTHTYRTHDGEQVPPIFQDDVKRDTYGLGVHSDPFGRAVYDSRP